MKKLLLLFIPLMFFSIGCEEEEICTGNATSDLLVGSWSLNNIILYYSNGDFYDCVNACNSFNSGCTDADCTQGTYNCDGSGSSSDGETFSWSYNPQSEILTSIGTTTTTYSSIIELSSSLCVLETDLLIIPDDGSPNFNVTAVISLTRL